MLTFNCNIEDLFGDKTHVVLLPNGGFIFSNSLMEWWKNPKQKGYIVFSPNEKEYYVYDEERVDIMDGSFTNPKYENILVAEPFKNTKQGRMCYPPKFLDENGKITNEPTVQYQNASNENEKYIVFAFLKAESPSHDFVLLSALKLKDGGIIILDKQSQQFRIFNIPAKEAYLNSQTILAYNDTTVYLIDNPFEAD